MTAKTWTWAFIATFYDDIKRMVEVCHACDVKALELHPGQCRGTARRRDRRAAPAAGG